ncbi:MAG: DUF131 domain-containing protein [Methanomassiliicoccales archaeon]|nr:DUF131 domain-containing protein [Methanomassiliicoccales archaeon]
MRRRICWFTFAALAVAAVALGAVATDTGQLSFYLVWIFPVLQAEGLWGVGTVLCALGAFIALFFTFFEVSSEGMDGKASTGGVLLIGPFPIVFGTDRRMTVIALVITVVVLASLVLFLLL